MLTQLKNIPKKSVVGKFMIALFILASASMAQAQAVAQTDSTKDIAAINYLGSEEGMFRFGFDYANNSGNKFMLEIKDSDGEIIFKELYSDKTFSKRFLFPKDLDNKLKVEFRNIKDNYSQAFEISTSERFSEEVAVKEIR